MATNTTSSFTRTSHCSSSYDLHALFNNKIKRVHDSSCFFADVSASVGQDRFFYPACAPGTPRQTPRQVEAILEMAESVMEGDGALFCLEEEQETLAPTPIGPLGITVVDNIPLEGCTQLDVVCRNPFSTFPPKAKLPC
jgi:hypothetical protein